MKIAMIIQGTMLAKNPVYRVLKMHFIEQQTMP